MEGKTCYPATLANRESVLTGSFTNHWQYYNNYINVKGRYESQRKRNHHVKNANKEYTFHQQMKLFFYYLKINGVAPFSLNDEGKSFHTSGSSIFTYIRVGKRKINQYI